MLATFQRWVKSLPPAVQTTIYAVETGVAAALSLFLISLYSAVTSAQGLAGFDWKGQLMTLAMGALAALLKALIDLLKATPPTQETKL